MHQPTDTRPGELWRPVVGYEGLYLVSSEGRVWSFPRSNGWKHGRYLRPATMKRGGYLGVALCRDGKARTSQVHVLVMAAFVGPRPQGLPHIRHLDGDPMNNCVTNLRYGTATENSLDTVAHGRNRQCQKVECPQGHPYDEMNTYLDGRGRRCCRICLRESGRRYRQRLRVAA